MNVKLLLNQREWGELKTNCCSSSESNSNIYEAFDINQQ
jgi:hypothetical protein